jgi:hypothetical protein
MATETVAAPISNSRSSDDEILGLTTHVPRRNGRAESNSSARESGTDEQLDLDFGGSDSQSGSARCADTTRRSLTISRQTWSARPRLRRQTTNQQACARYSRVTRNYGLDGEMPMSIARPLRHLKKRRPRLFC